MSVIKCINTVHSCLIYHQYAKLMKYFVLPLMYVSSFITWLHGNLNTVLLRTFLYVWLGGLLTVYGFYLGCIILIVRRNDTA